MGLKSHTCADHCRYYCKKGVSNVLLNFSLDTYQLLDIKCCWFCHLTTFEDSPSWWGTISNCQINHITVNSVVFIAIFLSCSDTKQPWELTLRAYPSCRNFRLTLVSEGKVFFSLIFFYNLLFGKSILS